MRDKWEYDLESKAVSCNGIKAGRIFTDEGGGTIFEPNQRENGVAPWYTRGNIIAISNLMWEIEKPFWDDYEAYLKSKEAENDNRSGL